MILVTGGTGMLGAHLLYALLERGENSIRATFRSDSAIEKTRKIFSYYTEEADQFISKIQWVKVDLGDIIEVFDAMEGVDVVYHCAAKVSFRPKDAYRLLLENPAITANLINAALRHDVKAFGHVSSVATLTPVTKNAVMDEESYWKSEPGVSTYSKSKYAAEMEAWRGVEEGLNVVIINPCVILGPGYWNDGSSQIFDTIAKGFPYYTQGENAVVDVRDVVEAFLRVMDGKYYGERFVVTGAQVKFKDLFERIALALGVKPAHKHAKPWMTEILWRIEKVRSAIFGSKPLITKETARTARKVSRYDSSKIIEKTGIQFRDLQTTIVDFSEFYKKDHSQK